MKANHNVLSNYYKVLEVLYDKQEKTPNGVNYTMITQSEIGELTGLHRMTINNILKEMQEDEFVVMLSLKKYQLTPYAIKVVKTIKKL